MPLSVITDIVSAQIPHPHSQCSYLVSMKGIPFHVKKCLMWRFLKFHCTTTSLPSVWNDLCSMKLKISHFSQTYLESVSHYQTEDWKWYENYLCRYFQAHCKKYDQIEKWVGVVLAVICSVRLSVSDRSHFCCRETGSGQVARTALACWDTAEDQDADRVQLGIVLGCKRVSSPARFPSAPCGAIVLPACSRHAGGLTLSLALPLGRDPYCGVNSLLFTLPSIKGGFWCWLHQWTKAIYTVWYSFSTLSPPPLL